EVNRVRVPTVLTAYTQTQVWPSGAAALHRDADEFADALNVNRLKRRDAEHALLGVRVEEGPFNVVTREAPRRLGEVIRAEGEELCDIGHPIRGEGGPRELDHCADWDVEVHALFGGDIRKDMLGLIADEVKLHDRGGKRDHDLGVRRAS